jgi:peptidoglycan/LPS O-acetylase OafA/YrhL
MTHTRYTAGNIALLVLSILFALLTAFTFAAIPADDATGFRTHCTNLLAHTLVLAIPATLIALRWSAVSSTTLWAITFAAIVLSILAHSPPDGWICFRLAIISTMISAVLVNSRDANIRDRIL